MADKCTLDGHGNLTPCDELYTLVDALNFCPICGESILKPEEDLEPYVVG